MTVKNRVDFELIPSNILVFSKKHPIPRTDNRQELDVGETGELVKGSGIMALRSKSIGDVSAKTLVDEDW